ncbi:MAG: IS91 family transposase [Spirochaetia bacterium]|nr:IS91 family transposase [Spirochaetia bacterium]
MAELQDIFNASFDEFCRNNFVSTHAQKVSRAIMNCRTSVLGGHIDYCPDPKCNYQRNSYNSCRNRHCPKCQTLKKEQWIGRRCEDILDTHHFHVVFTVPAELNTLFLPHPVALYHLLFRASSDTIKELTTDEKYLGAIPGFTSVLHSWGQNLSFHPHIHMVVTGGGLTDAGVWKSSKKKFFLPVPVVSKLFRGKFLAELKLLYESGVINYHNDELSFGELISACYKKDWIVYCKPPFAGTSGVFSYLGRYTHRVAISNNRILSVDESLTTFQFRDYSDGGKTKNMTLENLEFIRRFLMHVLPHGFTRIRHYGLYAPRNKATKLTAAKQATGTKTTQKPVESSLEMVTRLLGRDVSRCPQCNTTLLHRPLARASPA